MKNRGLRFWLMMFVGAGCALGWAAQASAAVIPALSPKYEKWLGDEVAYIITAKEKDVFLKLGADKERDVFIESFWKQRDPNPATPENEFKIQHYLRLQFADQAFGTPDIPGRKTPAGRLYIVTGTGDPKLLDRILANKKSFASGIQESYPWIMKMRIFEAAGKGGAEPVKAVTSSYLKYNLTATIKTEFDLAEETKQIQKTFNNPAVKLLTEADFSWKRNDREKAFHMFRLDGREYLVLVSPIDVLRRLTFRIEVFEQGEKTKANLLDTEFTIPEKNITIFGFEDSKGNVYFLSFSVSGWKPVPGAQTPVPYVIPAEGPVRAVDEIKPPRLLKQVDPIYPEIAKQANVEGIVILEAETDEYGRVKNTRILRSIPLLDQAAHEAVRQWVYEPMIIGGKPRGMIFTTTVRFTLDGKGKAAAAGGVVRGVVGGVAGGVAGGVEGGVSGAPLKLTSAPAPKLLKQVDPIYPPDAKKAGVEGMVIIEATIDIYGRVQSYKILRSIPPLDQAAVDAVKQWVYEPAILNGKPIPVSFTVTVQFTLK